MKKRLITFLLTGVMMFSFAVPAMANVYVAVDPVSTATEQEISPFIEMTQIAWRTYNGVLQFRVWSITNGRWLTEWADV